MVGSRRNLGIRESVCLNRELGVATNVRKNLGHEIVKALTVAVTK